LTSASHHFSLVVSTIVSASPMTREASSHWRSSAWAIADLLEVLVRQIGKNGEVDVVCDKARGILREADPAEPIANLRHRGTSRADGARTSSKSKIYCALVPCDNANTDKIIHFSLDQVKVGDHNLTLQSALHLLEIEDLLSTGAISVASLEGGYSFLLLET
jgi:hypothetical protein